MRYGWSVPSPTRDQAEIDTPLLAAELRGVIGQLIRRLRNENLFPLNQASVLGRLDREGPCSVSDLAAAERVRPQSMAQTVGDLEADGLVERSPDPDDRRREPTRRLSPALVEPAEDGEIRGRDGVLRPQPPQELPEDDAEIARDIRQRGLARGRHGRIVPQIYS